MNKNKMPKPQLKDDGPMSILQCCCCHMKSLINPGLRHHLGSRGNRTSHRVLLGVGSSDVPGEWQGAEALREEEQERVCFLIGAGWKHIHLPGGKGRA